MWMRSRVIAAFLAGVSLIVAVAVGVTTLVSYKQNASGGIAATGSATRDFTSDLIVWRGSFSAYGQSTTEAWFGSICSPAASRRRASSSPR